MRHFTIDATELASDIARIYAAIASSATVDLTVRLDGLDRLDLATLMLLLRIVGRANSSGAKCLLVDANSAVRRSLRTAGLHRVARLGESSS